MTLARPTATLLAAMALAGCRSAHSVLGPAGLEAERVHHVWSLYLGVSIAVFASVMAALAWALRPRVGASDEPAAPPFHDPARDLRAARVVAASLALTVVTLFVLLVDTVWAGHAIASLTARDPTTVRVIGHQWWWEVHYTDGSPAHEVVTANEIHIPAGVPVTFELVSRDVIHSFWVPELAGKRDAIPGHPTRVVMQADRPGVYRGQCAEFCGMQHAGMALRVVAEAPAAYRAWLAAQRAPAGEPAPGAEARGREVFLSRTCPMCHAVQGTPAGSANGPDLTHLASRSTLASGLINNTRGNLAGWIVNPQAIKPGSLMPPNALSPADLHDLIAYLESLR